MDLVGVYSALGQRGCNKLVRTISIGALRTYGVYEAIKIRSRLHTLNRQKLRASSPKLWKRIADGDEALARDLSEGVLVSNIPFIVAVLDFLGIEHDGSGFFPGDTDSMNRLTPGWASKVFGEFSGRYPDDLVLLYINHLGWETSTLKAPYLGPGAGTPDAAPDQSARAASA